MRLLDEPPFTWEEWNKAKPERQFDRGKFTNLAIVEKMTKLEI